MIHLVMMMMRDDEKKLVLDVIEAVMQIKTLVSLSTHTHTHTREISWQPWFREALWCSKIFRHFGFRSASSTKQLKTFISLAGLINVENVVHDSFLILGFLANFPNT